MTSNPACLVAIVEVLFAQQYVKGPPLERALFPTRTIFSFIHPGDGCVGQGYEVVPRLREFHTCLYLAREMLFIPEDVQDPAKRRDQLLVNFVPAVAYHFCLALPAAFKQPGDHLLAEPCAYDVSDFCIPAFHATYPFFRKIRRFLNPPSGHHMYTAPKMN